MVQDGAKKRPKLEPDVVTAPVVKRIFHMADTGRGMLGIAGTLNEEGIATATGKLWSKNGVHFILRNEVYTGTLVKGTAAKDNADPVLVDRAFPAIVSKSQFHRVNSLMRSRDRPPPQGGKPLLAQRAGQVLHMQENSLGPGIQEGQVPLYVCQSLIKKGSGSCHSPKLNTRRFE